jgi:hypothetical protein
MDGFIAYINQEKNRRDRIKLPAAMLHPAHGDTTVRGYVRQAITQVR